MVRGRLEHIIAPINNQLQGWLSHWVLELALARLDWRLTEGVEVGFEKRGVTTPPGA